MKELLDNKLSRIGASIICISYTVLLAIFSYLTFIYELVFINQVAFAIVYLALNVLYAVLLYYSRKQVATAINAMFLVPIVFTILLFNIASPIIFIPPLIIAVLMFFLCRANDTVKTVLGTIYLLLYIVGLIAFFLIRFLFGGATITTLNDNLDPDSPVYEMYDMNAVYHLNQKSVSPDGKYRFYIIDVEDNATGKVEIHVEPNDMDKRYRFFTLYEKGQEKRIAIYNSRGVLPEVEWVDDDQIQYKFPEDSEMKTSTVRLPKKDYFKFLYS